MKDDDIVLIHDCARPLISQKIILDNIKGCQEYGAVDTVIKATDTIVRSVDEQKISDIPLRKELYQGQTPQTFKFSIIYEAHKDATDNKIFDSTDDASLVIRMNKKVSIVLGDSSNKKITYKEDLK